MNEWLYNYIPLEVNFTTNDYGFIYKITNLETNKFYIGKKSFFHNKKKKKHFGFVICWQKNIGEKKRS